MGKNRKKRANKLKVTEIVPDPNGSSPEEREAKVLQNASVAINRLPVEVFVMIISLAISHRPFVKIPYRCVRFSSVCHHWRFRLAILNHAAFWKSIILNQCMTLPFFEKLRSRFKTPHTEIMMRYLGPEIHPFLDLLSADANHVNTLYVKLKSCPEDASNILPFFPSLENVFCHPDSFDGDRFNFETLRNHARSLKALQFITFDTIKQPEIAKEFHELRWLHLKYSDSLTPGSVLEPLQALPNLQVLYLYLEASGEPETEPVDRIVTLPELKVLISEHCPVMHLINAPKLTYADILLSDQVIQEDDCDLFCGFDFSRITHVCSMIGVGDTYIMGKAESEDIPPFMFNISRDADEGFFDLIPTSYPNRFHFAYNPTQGPDEFETKRFIACLKQATSLVEVVLNEFVAEGDGEYDNVFPFFDVLTGATTVRYINILSDGNFQMLCDILSNGTICPNLEKLTYCNSLEESDSDEESSNGEESGSPEETHSASDLYSCLQKLMKERSATRSTPLEVEIKGFDHVQPEELEQIEKLMVRLIQKEREETPILLEKEDYFEKYD